jgi:hypothetical protein
MLDRRARGWAAWALPWLVVVAAILWSRPASAYPWMIRHEYQGCVPCHADPSGAGLLTAYGRAMGENVLRMRYGSKPPDEPPVYSRFLFGVPEPDWLLAGGSVRASDLLKTTPGTAASEQFILMEADLRAQVTLGRFRAYGTLGFMDDGPQTYDGPEPFQITHNAQNNLVSREHWLGVDLGEDKQALLRAGRIDIPFGIRDDNHQLFVRSSMVTQTNINDSAQDGIAFSYNGQVVRGEVMAVLGNYLIGPDVFRQRGYAGFIEAVVAPKTTVGASSLVNFAKQDYLSNALFKTGLFNTVRQVHGAFARLSPAEPLVLLVEADATITTGSAGAATAPATTMPGFAGLIEADIEPVQGLHFIPAVETWIQGDYPTPTGGVTTGKSFSGWAGALWFFAPHADFRVDFVATSILNAPVQIYVLPQLHLYL